MWPGEGALGKREAESTGGLGLGTCRRRGNLGTGAGLGTGEVRLKTRRAAQVPRSRGEGQAAQRREADGPVGLGIAPQRGPRGPLGPLRCRGIKHPPTGPGRPRRSRRNLHTDEDRGPWRSAQRRERPAEGKGRGWGTGRGARGLTRGAPGAFAPRPGIRSLRIRARTATWAAACEVNEGTGSLALGFTWEGASGSVTGARVKEQWERSCHAPTTTYPQG